VLWYATGNGLNGQLWVTAVFSLNALHLNCVPTIAGSIVCMAITQGHNLLKVKGLLWQYVCTVDYNSNRVNAGILGYSSSFIT